MVIVLAISQQHWPLQEDLWQRSCSWNITFRRGGSWTKKKKEQDFDVIAMQPGVGHPRDWAQRFHLPAYKSWSVITHQWRGATRLAMECSRKLQHFFNIAVAAKDLNHSFTAEELASYQYSQEWLDWVDELPLVGMTRQRVVEVEAMLHRL